MPTGIVKDGLNALREIMTPKEIASLIERTARWVDPETFKLLPVWYPEHARGELFYKENWSKPLTNTNRTTGAIVHKSEGNVYAAQALTLALGLRRADRPNWSCCHVWGIDDDRYQMTNAVVRDRQYYSCVANMVLLPSPLKAFTDVMDDIKTMLRICARFLYGWSCDHKSLVALHTKLDEWNGWDAYPASWPRAVGDGKRPLGLVPLNVTIRNSAQRRLAQIRQDLKHAGEFYPKAEVLDILKDWKILEEAKAAA